MAESDSGLIQVVHAIPLHIVGNKSNHSSPLAAPFDVIAVLLEDILARYLSNLGSSLAARLYAGRKLSPIAESSSRPTVASLELRKLNSFQSSDLSETGELQASNDLALPETICICLGTVSTFDASLSVII